jgi:hypothetical protein
VLHRDAGVCRDLLGGAARPDLGLDVPRPQRVGLLDLQLRQPGPVPPDGGAQRLVDPEQVALPVGRGEDEVLTVVVNADEREVLHA